MLIHVPLFWHGALSQGDAIAGVAVQVAVTVLAMPVVVVDVRFKIVDRKSVV
jgi:hypothetical protein